MKLYYYMVCTLFVIGVFTIILRSSSKEGFMFHPYSRPNELNVGFYDVFIKPTLNDLNASTTSENKRVKTDMSTYKQETNNKRYWKQPDNGSCTPVDICDDKLYQKVDLTPEAIDATPPDFFNGSRVGFFLHENENID